VKHLLRLLVALVVLQPLAAMDAGQKAQLENCLSQRQYLTAAQFLDKLDPDNRDPDALVQKIQISINYFAQSMNHKLFAFKDLSGTETIESVRKQGGAFQFEKSLDVPAAVDALSARYPNDGRLLAALGDFYVDVFRRYGQNGPFPNCAQSAVGAYKRAIAAGAKEAIDPASVALVALQIGDYDLAEASYREALARDPNNAECSYNLAFAPVNLSKFADASRYANDAYRKYVDPKLKRDALLMYSDCLLYQSKTTEALDLYTKMLADEPQNLFILRRQIQCYLGLNRAAELEKVFNQYMVLSGADPTSVSRLSGPFQSSIEYTKRYIALADKWLKSAQAAGKADSIETQGTLSYYEAFAFKATGDQRMYRTRLNEAKAYFQKIFPSDHPIFKQIESNLEN